ncbi:ABC transporter permease [Nakamurella lactea]|uniref:ABC transporter permease n=1 Tax=Nakamurella lactea TaxID=459515 RepID=UPI000563C87D|nr:ABC transporter permease [Nakamurella lactea]
MVAALAVERIKLFSTKSPYWCLGVILLAVWGLGLAVALVDNGREATVFVSQTGSPMGMMTFMVMAALTITTEYRFGTIRNSFLAVPQRALVLAAKTVLMAFIGAVTGAVASLGGFFLVKALATDPDVPLQLSSAADYRMVLGYSALYAIGAVLAIGVGTLVRQSAGAITALLLWPLLVETLLMLISGLRDMTPYLPFNAGFNFVAAGGHGGMFGRTAFIAEGPSAQQGLVIFLVTALVIWLLALLSLYQRDA